jgi:hypothetical protein
MSRPKRKVAGIRWSLQRSREMRGPASAQLRHELTSMGLTWAVCTSPEWRVESLSLRLRFLDRFTPAPHCGYRRRSKRIDRARRK